MAEEGSFADLDIVRPGDHDAGVRAIAVEVVAQAGINDHLAGILRGMHEPEHAVLIAIGQSDMRSVSLGPGRHNADDVPVAQIFFRGGDLGFWNVQIPRRES